MGAEEVAVTQEAGVLRVTINRPEKRNALSRPLLARLGAIFAEHANDQDLRVAVLRGAGDKSFAAGGDLRELAAIRTEAGAAEMADQAKAALDAIRVFPLPVIAALNGDALGGGAELAVACDLRIAAAHARIGFVQGRLNITTAWGGSLDLIQLVGPAVALRLLGRSELLGAAEAARLGLIDEVAGQGQSLDEAVDAFLAPFRAQRPQVLRAFKALTAGARRGEPRAALAALETRNFARAWAHDDHWAAADKVLASQR